MQAAASIPSAVSQDLRWNVDPVNGHLFPKLRLTHKPNLVQLRGGMESLPITQAEQRAIPLKPEEWKQKLMEATRDDSGTKPVVLDVRNGYEWDAGHFIGAQRPTEDCFKDTPTEDDIPVQLTKSEKDTPILMYCTGGIRCDIYSTVLRRNGFHNLYSLEGGVQQYFKEEREQLWNGSLFVFDDRMAIHPAESDGILQELPAAVECQLCGDTGSVPHLNCANVDCNRLFVACQPCKNRLRGSCCEECMTAPRLLRPMLQRGRYGKVGTYAMNRLKKSLEETTERELVYRKRNRDKVRAKRLALKEAKLQTKKEIQEETRRRGEPEGSIADAIESMARDPCLSRERSR